MKTQIDKSEFYEVTGDRKPWLIPLAEGWEWHRYSDNAQHPLDHRRDGVAVHQLRHGVQQLSEPARPQQRQEGA